MVKLVFEDQTYLVQESESVLECLLRHGLSRPSSCRSGICQTCIMKAQSGRVPAASQKGLKASLQQQGYFLSCVCHPEEDLQVVEADAVGFHTQGELLSRTALNPSIDRLRWRLQEAFPFRGGQFIHLHTPKGIRSYSIASASHESDIELHVKRYSSGRVSQWLHELPVGSQVEISGPLGECFYQSEGQQKNILLAGTGSGLAPLWGVLQDALANEHKGKIILYHGSSVKEGLYFQEELTGLSQIHSAFEYIPCLSRQELEGYEHGHLDDIIKASLADLKDWSVFLCGHPELVNKLKRQVYLAGASLNDIHADPFISAKPNG